MFLLLFLQDAQLFFKFLKAHDAYALSQNEVLAARASVLDRWLNDRLILPWRCRFNDGLWFQRNRLQSRRHIKVFGVASAATCRLLGDAIGPRRLWHAVAAFTGGRLLLDEVGSSSLRARLSVPLARIAVLVSLVDHRGLALLMLLFVFLKDVPALHALLVGAVHHLLRNFLPLACTAHVVNKLRQLLVLLIRPRALGASGLFGDTRHVLG